MKCNIYMHTDKMLNNHKGKKEMCGHYVKYKSFIAWLQVCRKTCYITQMNE